MLVKVLTILFSFLVCCNASYNTYGSYGTYGSQYGLGYPGASAYYSPLTIIKAPAAYTLPSLGLNTVQLTKNVYSYPSDLDTFYGGSAFGVGDSGLGTAALIENGLYSGNLNYGYSPSLSVVGKYALPLKK